MHTVIIKLVMQLKKTTNVTYLVGYELRKEEEEN